MRKEQTQFLGAIFLATLLVAVGAQAQQPPGAHPRLIESYGKLPLSFEANNGQTDQRVQFLSRGPGYTLFLTPSESVLVFTKSDVKASGPLDARLSGKKKQTATALRIRLVGVNPARKVEGLDELPGKSNYFIGNDPKKWRTNVPMYAKVKYSDIYPGSDLIYYGNQRRLEYDFVVAPGPNPKAIQLAIAGLSEPRSAVGTPPLQIDANGDLVIQLDGGDVRFHKPVVYQPVALNRQSQITNRQSVLRRAEPRRSAASRAAARGAASMRPGRPATGAPFSSTNSPRFEIVPGPGPGAVTAPARTHAKLTLKPFS